MLYPLLLLLYHLYLKALNLTTKEYLRNLKTKRHLRKNNTTINVHDPQYYDVYANVFNTRSYILNLIIGICQPRGANTTNPRDYYTYDQTFDKLPKARNFTKAAE